MSHTHPLAAFFGNLNNSIVRAFLEGTLFRFVLKDELGKSHWVAFPFLKAKPGKLGLLSQPKKGQQQRATCLKGEPQHGHGNSFWSSPSTGKRGNPRRKRFAVSPSPLPCSPGWFGPSWPRTWSNATQPHPAPRRWRWSAAPRAVFGPAGLPPIFLFASFFSSSTNWRDNSSHANPFFDFERSPGWRPISFR